MELLINQTFEDPKGHVRLLAAEDGTAVYYAYRGGAEKPGLHKVPLKDFSDRVSSPDCRSTADPYASLRYVNLAPESKSYKRGMENYKLIEDVVKDRDYLFDDKLRRSLILAAAKEDKVKVRKIYRLLETWWERGQMPNALYPGCVLRKDKKVNYTQKPGRKRRDQAEGTVITDEIKSLFVRVCRRERLKSTGRSLHGTYIVALSEFKNKYPNVPDKDCPTFNQFCYFYYRTFSHKERSVKLHTSIAYNKDIRPLTGTVYDIANAPGVRYEIDATEADVFVVSDDRKVVLGRPTLYVVVDVYTGMVVAVNLNMSPPRFQTAADTLFIAISNKKEWVESHGLNYIPELWPLSGLPEQVAFDNAELRGEQIEFFSRAFAVDLDSEPPFRADGKGPVERAIQTLQQHAGSYANDAKPCKIELRKAGATDNRHKSVLTLEEAYREYIIAAMIANHTPNTCTPPGVTADNGCSPLELCAFAKNKGTLRTRRPYDQKLLRLSLMRQEEASITDEGIKAAECCIKYYCQKAADAGMLERGDSKRRGKVSKNMRLAIDGANVSCAYLMPDIMAEPETCWPCRLAPVHRHLAGMTLDEAAEYLKKSAEARSRSQEKADHFAAKCHEQLSKIESDAKEAVGGSKPEVKITKERLNQERALNEKKHPRLEPAEDDRSLHNAGNGPVEDEDPDEYSFPVSFD